MIHTDRQTSTLIAAFDWSATSLGDRPLWPQSLRTAVDIVLNSPLAMVLIHGADKAMIYNDSYAQIAGAHHPQTLGANVDAIWPEAQGWNHDMLERGFRGEVQTHRAQPVIFHPGGVPQEFWLDLFYVPVYNENNNVSAVLVTVIDVTSHIIAQRQQEKGKEELRKVINRDIPAARRYVGVAFDITERKQIEEARRKAEYRARESNRFTRLLLNSTEEAFYSLDREGVATLCNAAFVRMLGFSSESEVLGRKLHHLIHHSHADGSHYDVQDCPIHRAAQTGVSAHIDHEFFYRTDGSRFPVEYRVQPIWNDGVLQGAICTFRDITIRKERLEALRASEDRLATIFGQASVGLSELDLNGNFTRVNDALCGMMGRSQEEMLRLNVNEMIHPDDLADNTRLFNRLTQHGEPFTLEKCYIKPDGSHVWISSNLSRIVDPAGKPQALIAVKTDISERRKAEDALRQLNETLEQRVADEFEQRIIAEEALRQSQKMDALGQLTGGVAHDFNNVLQIIAGNLQLLQTSFAGDALARNRLEKAVAAVDRGAKLSGHLLAFARRQPLRPEVANLGRLVRKMDDLLRRVLGEAISVETIVSGGLWNTLVDPGQIENVILNLAINARDAMNGDGKLTIELGNAVLDQRYAMTQADLEAGQYVLLSVSDNGCGMIPAVLEKAFDPFFTTKPEGEGTGLGLSMTYGFVKQSRGHIKIDSKPGQGTTVRIYLPCSIEAEADLAATLDGPVVGGTETILVVEDDENVRTTVVDILSTLGYRLLKAENALDALATLAGGVPVDLIFTDVVMPGPVRSTELVQQAKALFPDIAVLFTSGYTRDAIMHGGRLAPGVELLSKPYRREDLARKIRFVLHNREQTVLAKRMPLLNGHIEVNKGSDMSAQLLSRILVVEDNVDSNEMLCELLRSLDHAADGVTSAEDALNLLNQRDFDIVITDISLPGMSGIELAKKIAREKPAVKLVFASGYDVEIAKNLNFPVTVLPKPFDFTQLEKVLNDLIRGKA